MSAHCGGSFSERSACSPTRVPRLAVPNPRLLNATATLRLVLQRRNRSSADRRAGTPIAPFGPLGPCKPSCEPRRSGIIIRVSGVRVPPPASEVPASWYFLRRTGTRNVFRVSGRKGRDLAPARDAVRGALTIVSLACPPDWRVVRRWAWGCGCASAVAVGDACGAQLEPKRGSRALASVRDCRSAGGATRVARSSSGAGGCWPLLETPVSVRLRERARLVWRSVTGARLCVAIFGTRHCKSLMLPGPATRRGRLRADAR